MNAKPAEPKDTREQIMKLASDLLRERGFAAFSYGHIAESLGVKPAAIHYHFATKTDLGMALIGRYRDRYRRWMSEADDQDLPPQEKLAGYFRIAARFSEDGKRICPGGALEAELMALPPEMQSETKAMVKDIYAWLTQVLADGKKAGAFRFDGAAADMAMVIGAALQGGIQVARVMGQGALDSIVRQLHKQLGL
jgi:AcrR family transcriptional regulator